MIKKDFVAGASSSLNKTITEIMDFLNDEGSRPPTQLRKFLHLKIAILNRHWYKRGFRRGHCESLKKFQKTGRVPSVLVYEATRKFFLGQNRPVRVKSKQKI